MIRQLTTALVWMFLVPIPAFSADEPPAIPFRPAVPGTLRLRLRERQETAPKSGTFKVVERQVDWQVSETAIIICDMWEDHPCKMSAHRVDVMAPEMNRVVAAARSLGVQIIHSPSSGIPHYETTPQRQRLKLAPLVNPPVPIEGWCYLDPQREADYPIPYSTKVEDGCDDPVYAGDVPTCRLQHAAIKIVGYDGVSDNGVEVFNFFEQIGIKNVVLMGVHTHYCVLGRSFGIRQMVRLGKNVVLCRDLTDAMYDPRKPPYVSHQRGTELAIEHVEKYWCPSITSADLVTIFPGTGDPEGDCFMPRGDP
ncbi:MAG: protein-signal peptide and transmembrane prediction [Planctomycetales bacterium]